MDEQQFRKVMIKVRSLAKSQGERISKEQVERSFGPLNIEESHLNLIFDYLKEEKVRVFDSDKELEEVRSTFPDERVRMNKEDSEYLKMYIGELNLMDIPSKEERSVILDEIINDRSKAAILLPNLYLKEVVDVARLYEGQGVALEDLVGEGNVSILTGLKLLDCCESAEEIEEFMVRMIMDSMEAMLMDRFDIEDFDLKVLERVNTLNDKAKEMAEDLERLITVEELAAELETDEEYIRETLRISGNSIEYIKDK
ncbi:MAG: hypothetical protein K6F34_11295 [Lachnospiraceae bacterium]|nr:hypothetical protein [Lachnospiraceae bacterium]